MLNIMMLVLFFGVQNMIYDFTSKSDISEWYTTNDTVMGGISNSSIQINKNGNGVFSGRVSTENNGGFAMVRLPVFKKITQQNSNIVLRVKGDGKKYQLRLKSKRNQRYWYVQHFQTSKNWQEISLKIEDFYPSFRGYKLQLKNFNAQEIQEVAILIGNKKDEEFKLEIDYIKLA
jgi:NADH dehydrogenase [ubiquinone] 1 alpha subcomplex assembly factor 1